MEPGKTPVLVGPGVSLKDVYDVPGGAAILWNLLKERDPAVNISHKRMPTMAEHVRFMNSRPYLDWWLIFTRDIERPYPGHVHGACYVSRNYEIGIQLFKDSQGKGIAFTAVAMLIEMHKEKRLLANINPMNEQSMRLFRKFGFKLCQYTYELERP